jgi:hypothetical protein
MSDGCCGQQQEVICNVTGLRIVVTAGTIEQVFTFDARNTTFDMNGFEVIVDAMLHPTIDFNFIFIAKILYIADAMTSNLTISCSNVVSFKNITIPVNSSPCIYHAPDAMNTTVTHTQNDDNTFDLTVSLGISDESTVPFQQCNVTLQCQNCSTPISRNTTRQLQPCTSDGLYSNIPEGNYSISGNISTECGELIPVTPVSTYVGPISVRPGSGNSSGSVSSILGVFATTLILVLLS